MADFKNFSDTNQRVVGIKPEADHPAIRFLKRLDPSPQARFNIEHYTDLPKGAKRLVPDPLRGRHQNLSLDDAAALLPELRRLNDFGAGIFVARNECEGHRSEKNVTRVRGAHADFDDVTEGQIEQVIKRLEPSIVVTSSSPLRCHMYWQLAEGEVLDKAEAKAINQSLVAFGADPAAVDVSRLLRLPGFKHMKYRADGKTPYVSANYSELTYTVEEVCRAFKPTSIKSPASGLGKGEVATTSLAVGTSALLAEVEKTIATKHATLWNGDWENVVRTSGEIGYPSQSEADLALASHITRACIYAGISGDALCEAVATVFGRSELGTSEKWRNRDDYRDSTLQKALRGQAAMAHVLEQGVLQLESHGDVRNARAFASEAYGDYLYVATRDSWLRWHESRWKLCEKGEHVAKAKAVCQRMLEVAGRILGQDQERGKKLVQDAVASHNLNRINAMLALAVSEPGMATTDQELDSDPFLLGVSNGVVDLRNGRHLFNRPEMRITRYCNAAFDEHAKCERWLLFVNEVFGGDAETIACVQVLLGLTLLGLTGEEILVICVGFGRNGKSVFSNTIYRILGGYAVTAPSTLLTARKSGDNSPRNDIATLAGARYVSINEMQAGDKLDEQVVKNLAGREPISARFLHKEFFEFFPTFTPWLRTNHKPIITGEDDGIWRRLVLVPFRRKFTDDEVDPHLEEKLLAEQDGILQWMIQGAQMYLRDGVRLSQTMKAEVASYRKDSDLLGEFLADETKADPGQRVQQAFLYEAYRRWCQESGLRPLSKKSFTQRLAERGYQVEKSGGSRYYVGLLLSWGWLDEPQVGGVDRMSSTWAKSLMRDQERENTQNGPASCPTYPEPATDEEKANA